MLNVFLNRSQDSTPKEISLTIAATEREVHRARGFYDMTGTHNVAGFYSVWLVSLHNLTPFEKKTYFNPESITHIVKRYIEPLSPSP